LLPALVIFARTVLGLIFVRYYENQKFACGEFVG